MSAAAELLIEGIEEFGQRFTDSSPSRVNYQSISNRYARLNLEPGSAVLILASNSFEFLQHWLALIANGLVPVAASPSLKSSRIKHLQKSLTISGLVGAKLNPSLYGVPDYQQIGTLRFIQFPGTPAAYSPYETLILTSGTSGMNTACVHSIDSLIENAKMHNRALNIRSLDKQLVVLPMYYSYAMVAQTIGAMVSGCELLIDGPPFTAERFSAAISRGGVSVSAITPTIVRGILQDGSNLPPLRVLSVGGDQLKVSDVEQFREKKFINELYLTYGLTEAGPRVATLAAHAAAIEQLDSVGTAFAEIETRIDSANNSGIGELLIRTPTALRRKVGEQVTQPLRPDGFLATGDLFTKDNAGYLRFIGRTRDFVLIQGEKVNIKSVSQTAERHPDVKFAKASVTIDGAISLAVSPRENAEIKPSELNAFLQQSLQSFEMPTEITQIDSADFQK